jgi:hypothetical protein
MVVRTTRKPSPRILKLKNIFHSTHATNGCKNRRNPSQGHHIGKAAIVSYWN